MQCLKVNWHHNSDFGGIQAIQAFGVEAQPQGAGRKIPNEDNKKGRCHICTCRQDRKSRQKRCKCTLFVCNDHAEATVICSNCIL